MLYDAPSKFSREGTGRYIARSMNGEIQVFKTNPYSKTSEWEFVVFNQIGTGGRLTNWPRKRSGSGYATKKEAVEAAWKTFSSLTPKQF